ncbi:MAG: BrnT family toxin [Candidatus Thiodiazotropha sp.]
MHYRCPIPAQRLKSVMCCLDLMHARLVVVVYTYRGDSIRIISARRATKAERICYEKGV